MIKKDNFKELIANIENDFGVKYTGKEPVNLNARYIARKMHYANARPWIADGQHSENITEWEDLFDHLLYFKDETGRLVVGAFPYGTVVSAYREFRNFTECMQDDRLEIHVSTDEKHHCIENGDMFCLVRERGNI